MQVARVEVGVGGSEVEVAVGDEIVVRRPENATTGFQWDVRDLPSGLEIVSNELDLGGKTAPGAGGERVIVMRPVRPGVMPVRVVLARTWETGPPQEEFSFLVRVG